MTSRRRPTELARETARRATSVSIALGRRLKDARLRRRLTQRDLAARVGISQSTYSRIERWLGARVALETWIALGVALDEPFAASFSRPIDPGPADAGHLEIQEAILGLARASGRPGTFEVPTRPLDPSRSTDVGIRDIPRRLRILVECWDTFGDLGAATRATQRKGAEARAAWPEDRVATVWVVRATAANRAILARYPHIIEAAFPGSSRAWVRTLTHGDDPPTEPGLVWFDPRSRSGRLTEHRRARMRP